MKKLKVKYPLLLVWRKSFYFRFMITMIIIFSWKKKHITVILRDICTWQTSLKNKSSSHSSLEVVSHWKNKEIICYCSNDFKVIWYHELLNYFLEISISFHIGTKIQFILKENLMDYVKEKDIYIYIYIMNFLCNWQW